MYMYIQDGSLCQTVTWENDFQNVDAAFPRHPAIAGQLYLVVVVSDFSLLELLSEQDQGLIAGKWTPPEFFGAQRRSLQVCRGLLVLPRVSSKAFQAVTKEKAQRSGAAKLSGTSVFQHRAPANIKHRAGTEVCRQRQVLLHSRFFFLQSKQQHLCAANETESFVHCSKKLLVNCLSYCFFYSF